MPGRVWKAVETKAGKVRIAETERGREDKKQKGKKTKKDRSTENSRIMGDLG